MGLVKRDVRLLFAVGCDERLEEKRVRLSEGIAGCTDRGDTRLREMKLARARSAAHGTVLSHRALEARDRVLEAALGAEVDHALAVPRAR